MARATNEISSNGVASDMGGRKWTFRIYFFAMLEMRDGLGAFASPTDRVEIADKGNLCGSEKRAQSVCAGAISLANVSTILINR